MKIKVRQTAEAAILDLVNPGVDGAEDAVVSSRTLSPDTECTITLPDVHDPSGVEFGDVVVSTPPEAATPPADQPPADPAPADTPAEPKDLSEVPAGLGIGRIVVYRSRTGSYDLPAIVNCTVATLDQEGVNQGHVPELTAPARVHLTVFTCGIPGTAREGNEVNEGALGGSYQEFNIPQFVPTGAEGEEIVPGTWRWPEIAS